jgi:hypothetical protein
MTFKKSYLLTWQAWSTCFIYLRLNNNRMRVGLCPLFNMWERI